MVTEEQLKRIKRELEGYKEEKMKAEVLLDSINKEIQEKEEELRKSGIESENDLRKMEQEIEDDYNKIMQEVENYRNAVRG